MTVQGVLTRSCGAMVGRCLTVFVGSHGFNHGGLVSGL